MIKAIGAIIVIIILAAGGYYIYTNMMQSGAPPASSATATTTPPLQVQAQDLTVGTGTEAIPGSIVSVLYVGKLTDGTTFDSSEAHNNEPLTFTLGTEGLIPGFQIGINGMKEGGQRLLAIPPEFAYGAVDVKDATGKVIIPAGSTLLFDVKLINVTASTSTPAATPAGTN